MGTTSHGAVDASLTSNHVDRSLHRKAFLFMVAILVCTCVINACIESMWELASDSRLPKWITLPPGLTRADVRIVEEVMEPTGRGVDIKVILYDNKYKKLQEVRGKSFDLSGRYFLGVVDDLPEIIGLKTQKDKRGDDFPYFFVVDDAGLKKHLLDDNRNKLLADGLDYRSLRKKLLGENGNAGTRGTQPQNNSGMIGAARDAIEYGSE